MNPVCKLTAAVAAIFTACAWAGPPRSVTLDGDLGCDTLQVQQELWAALQVLVLGTQQKVQGKATPETLRWVEVASARYAYLSRESCRRLVGPFRVFETQQFDGVKIVRVGFGKGSLWVLMP